MIREYAKFAGQRWRSLSLLLVLAVLMGWRYRTPITTPGWPRIELGNVYWVLMWERQGTWVVFPLLLAVAISLHFIIFVVQKDLRSRSQSKPHVWLPVRLLQYSTPWLLLAVTALHIVSYVRAINIVAEPSGSAHQYYTAVFRGEVAVGRLTFLARREYGLFSLTTQRQQGAMVSLRDLDRTHRRGSLLGIESWAKQSPLGPEHWMIIPLVYFEVVFVILFGICLRSCIREATVGESLCGKCGYDLRGTSGRCPECGNGTSVTKRGFT